MTTNVPGNLERLSRQRYTRLTLAVTFMNGKKMIVYAYPRSYVNLANKYMNLKQKPYRVNKNSINWNHSTRALPTNKNIARKNDYVIMRQEWNSWLNRNFPSDNKRVPKIKSFVEKSEKEQKTPYVRYVNGKYVKVPTLRNRAAYVLEQVRSRKQRLAKIKEALKHAFEYERAKKRWAGMSRMRYQSENYPAY